MIGAGVYILVPNPKTSPRPSTNLEPLEPSTTSMFQRGNTHVHMFNVYTEKLPQSRQKPFQEPSPRRKTPLRPPRISQDPPRSAQDFTKTPQDSLNTPSGPPPELPKTLCKTVPRPFQDSPSTPRSPHEHPKQDTRAYQAGLVECAERLNQYT
jgi:hypothetical protein